MLNILSLLGAAFVLLGYVMVATQRWSPTGLYFNLQNFASALLLGYVAVQTGVLGYMLLNLFGIVMSTYMLGKFVKGLHP